MRVLYICMLFTTFSSKMFAQNKKSSDPFESASTRDYIIEKLNKSYDSISYLKFADTFNFPSDIDIVTNERHLFSSQQFSKGSTISNLNQTELRRLLSDKTIFNSIINDGYGNSIEYFCPCSQSYYTFGFYFYVNRENFVELILAPNTKKFILNYRNKNECFMILESCINDYGWGKINKLLKNL